MKVNEWPVQGDPRVMVDSACLLPHLAPGIVLCLRPAGESIEGQQLGCTAAGLWSSWLPVCSILGLLRPWRSVKALGRLVQTAGLGKLEAGRSRGCTLGLS